MDKASYDDEAVLIAASRTGDLAAWSDLCRTQAPRLAAYLGARLRRPSIVDQLVAESIIGAWRYLDELPEGADFGTWFRKLGAGIALRWAREHPDEALDESFPLTRTKIADVAEEQALVSLDRSIGALDETARMAIELRWRAGMTGAELGAALRMTAASAEQVADEAEVKLEQEMAKPLGS